MKYSFNATALLSLPHLIYQRSSFWFDNDYCFYIPELILDIGEDFLGIRYILSNSDLILATPVSLDISLTVFLIQLAVLYLQVRIILQVFGTSLVAQ